MDVPRSKRALVIGARGVLGALTVRAFTAAGWTVRSGVRRASPGQVEIDLDRPGSIAAALDERELVVNTVPHPDLLAERHVLEHGGKLINVSDLPAAAGRALRAVAAGAHGTVLMNAGLAPGVTSVVAGDLLGLHPDAEELEIVFTLSNRAFGGPASADFVRRCLATVDRHRTAPVPLPPPFGERLCVGFGEGETGWLGGVAEGRLVRLYLCVVEPAAHERLLAMNSAGAMTTVPSWPTRPREAVANRPGDEPVAHWIAVVRGGRRLSARTVECRGHVVHAARSAVVFADRLLARRPQGGCFGPEEICTLAGVEPDLRDAGIAIVSRSTHSPRR